MLFRARRPRHGEDVFEGERDQAADRRLPLPHQRDAGPVPEGFERGAEELSRVHGRAEVAHAGREEPVELVELLDRAELDRETGPLGLPDLVAHAAIELPPQRAGVGRQRQHHVDLVLHRLPRDLESLCAAELDDAGPLAARLLQEVLDEAGGKRGGARTGTAAIEKRHRRHDRPNERPPHDERGEKAETSRVVFGGEIERIVTVTLADGRRPLG